MITLLDAAQDEAHYVFRHRCPCGERFAVRVPVHAPVSCRKCNIVSFATPEPCDEVWWTWFVAQPLNRKMLNLPPLYVAEPPNHPPPAKPVKEQRKISDAGVPL